MKRYAYLIGCAVVLGITAFSAVSFAQLIPQAVITPDAVDFPDTRVGQTSTTETLTVTKSQSFLPLYIFGVRLGDSTNFTVVSDGCSDQTLNDGDSCDIGVAFGPAQRGHFETSIAIISISRDIIDYATLRGEGIAPAVKLSATSVDFGEQSVGYPSSPHEIILLNSGTSDLTITSIAASGDFTQTNDCGSTVATGGTCGIDMVFTPTTTGARTGTVTIDDDAPDTPQLIALQGTGVTPPVPDLSLSTHVLDFGNQEVGTTSAPETVVATNSGTTDVSIISITVDGDYAQTNDCTPTLAPDASCNIDTTFSPTTTGARDGTLTVNSNAGDSPQTVSLSGTGVDQNEPFVELSATTVDFGEQTIDVPSQVKTLTLTNTGTSDLIGEGSAISGEGAANFSTLNKCNGVKVKVGGTCTIEITFTPTSDGAVSATLTITNNASNSPQTVTLKGTGIGGGATGGGCSLMRRMR